MTDPDRAGVSEDEIRTIAVEIVFPRTQNASDSTRQVVLAAELVRAYLEDCDGDRADFERRLWALNLQLSGQTLYQHERTMIGWPDDIAAAKLLHAYRAADSEPA
jgi:hypothetical protein